MNTVQVGRRRKSGLVAAVLIAVILSFGYFAVRLRPTRLPYSGSMTYQVLFTWDSGIKSLTVINDKTGQEEKNNELRWMIATEAKKTLPSVIEHLGLRRAQGPLYCRLAGTKDLYSAVCDALDKELTEQYDPDARKPLLIAAKQGDLAAIKELIDSGADLNTTDQHGRTALMRAVQLDDTMVLKTIVAAGADLNAQDFEGQTALFAAVKQGNIRAVQILVAAGANVNVPDKKGWTPLMEAAAPEVVRSLLAAGANVNATNQNGETALMVAALFSKPAVVKILLTVHPDVNIRSKDGRTALGLAKSIGGSRVRAMLEKAGAVE